MEKDYIQKLKNENETLVNINSYLKEENRKLLNNKLSLKTYYEGLVDQILISNAGLEQKIENKNLTIEELNKTIITLNNDLKAKELEIKELKEYIGIKNREIEEIKQISLMNRKSICLELSEQEIKYMKEMSQKELQISSLIRELSKIKDNEPDHRKNNYINKQSLKTFSKRKERVKSVEYKDSFIRACNKERNDIFLSKDYLDDSYCNDNIKEKEVWDDIGPLDLDDERLLNTCSIQDGSRIDKRSRSSNSYPRLSSNLDIYRSKTDIKIDTTIKEKRNDKKTKNLIITRKSTKNSKALSQNLITQKQIVKFNKPGVILLKIMILPTKVFLSILTSLAGRR